MGQESEEYSLWIRLVENIFLLFNVHTTRTTHVVSKIDSTRLSFILYPLRPSLFKHLYPTRNLLLSIDEETISDASFIYGKAMILPFSLSTLSVIFFRLVLFNLVANKVFNLLFILFI